MNLPNLRIVTNHTPPSAVAQFTAEKILSHLVPDPSTFDAGQLPLLKATRLGTPPSDLYLFLCARLRDDIHHFFYSMIRRWLIPGKEMNVTMQLTVDFTLPDLMPDPLIGALLSVKCESESDRELIAKHLPTVLAELRLGLDSPYHATRILETRGLSYDEKTTLVQTTISQLIKRRPQDFDYDIVSDMQRFLVLCKDDFKWGRNSRHLSRIICTHYLFRKSLQLSLDAFPERRYVSVKLIGARLQGGKAVLGIAVGLSFLKENEVFEARHILGAVKSLIPDANKVDSSFYLHPPTVDGIYLLYLEIEKGGEPFSSREIALLKQELAGDLKERIEQRHNPLFMPANEEMVMRHIVTLTGELTSVRDLPQVIIDFSEQTEEKLEFRVILLRIKTLSHPPIRHLFELSHRPNIDFRFDRRRTMGTLRKKYKKEANVFHLSVSKSPYLRQDHSIDLYRARQQIVEELRAVIGEFRDYNGGTISKETELFAAVREQLGNLADENHFLLENFFFGLSPPVMRSILPADALAKLFTMVIDAKIDGLPADESYQIRIEEDRSNYYLLTIVHEVSLIEGLLEHAEFSDADGVATCLIEEGGLSCFGVICRHHDPEEARELWRLLEKSLDQKISFISR